MSRTIDSVADIFESSMDMTWLALTCVSSRNVAVNTNINLAWIELAFDTNSPSEVESSNPRPIDFMLYLQNYLDDSGSSV